MPSPEHPAGWRGDGTGRFPGANPVTKWSTNENVLWRSEVGLGQSSPIVVGQRVLLTAEPDLLLCLAVDTGKELWRKTHQFYELPAELNAKDPGQSSQYGDVNPTPISDGKCVWVFVGTGIVACYDLDGTRLWIQAFDLPLATSYGRTASPVLVRSNLLIHFGPLVCLDSASGKVRWKNDKAKATYGTPVPARIGGIDVVITPKGDVVRVTDGGILADSLGNCMYSSPILQDNVVYFIDGEVCAVRLPDKAADQIQCKELWSGNLPGEFFASPVLENGRIYAVDKSANYYVLDASTGKTIFNQTLPFFRTDNLNAYPSPSLAGKHLLIGTDLGESMLLKTGQESMVVGTNSLPYGSGATPAFSGKRMFVRGGKFLYCIGSR
jgi:outer membrane protein assembly factor BamB